MPSFIYPLKGVYFFLTNPKVLWLKTVSPIALTLIFSAFSIGVSIKFLLPHQAEKLIEWHWPPWMSWFVSILSTVLESAILNLVFFALLVPMFQDAVFDATLEACGLHCIFEEEERREIPKLVLCWRSVRSTVLVTWYLIAVKILLLVFTLPLQLVPFLGTFVACYISGFPTAWSQRLHYDIELRGYRVSESYRHAKTNKWRYANFGSIAFALELVPIMNIVFVWTNIVGAALWVADDYRREKGLLPKKVDDPYPAAKAPTTTADMETAAFSAHVVDEQTPLLT
ncbi:hypothetical protein BDF20DRAFT_910002 [Mycotypha africana]|uniref:uncharacterized protein n=1 Tax=Mycotypha africana TaxID=64632 RepID=UPI00230078F3|nr:uncharacterized protein BDF20DRAFT_910002 [Mycotypha africana]KAI8987371.1 hypothetical protein BDF20DRAFT_910002 [Mycotypha africana]